MWLSISILIDYACTLFFSGNMEHLINNEQSVLLIYAIKSGMLIPFVVFMMVLYFMCTYFTLDILQDQRVFPVASLSVALIAISHTFGGMSWYFRSDLYSDMVMAIPMISLVLLVLSFTHLLIWKRPTPATS